MKSMRLKFISDIFLTHKILHNYVLNLNEERLHPSNPQLEIDAYHMIVSQLEIDVFV